MKHIFILVVSFIFMSSCSGTQKVIESSKTHTNKELSATTLVPNQSKILVNTKLPEADSALQIGLGEDGTIIDGNITETTEIIYNKAFDHSMLNDLLQKYVSNTGNVDYTGFKNDYKILQSYIDLLKTNQPLDSWTKNDKLAYWINAYNALTIDLILRNYPTKSIKDIKDPWDQRLWQFGDKWQNLNTIEHEILRKMDEPRIHFAIVCASVSCPKLQNEAFTALTIEKQLTEATKEFLSDTSKNKLSENRIKISKIFKWFKKDFEKNGSIIDFLNQYSDVKISKNVKKNYTDYNWDLND